MRQLEIVLVGAVAVVLGCAHAEKAGGSQPSAEPQSARAQLEPKSGSQVTGRADFTQEEGAVRLRLTVSGLEPGSHAVHLHEVGDCSAEDASSAGPHWNPTSAPHGRWSSGAHHLGDIGNLEAGPDGSASLTMTAEVWELGTGAERDIVGKALLVHAKADDFESQPAGAAGARVACGVVALVGTPLTAP